MNNLFVLSLTALLLSGCGKAAPVKQARAILGTIAEITVADTDKQPKAVHQAIEKAFAEIERIEDLTSRFKKDSEVSRINANACLRPIEVSEETFALIRKAIEYSFLTDGAFDITVYPLIEAWGLEHRDGVILPSAEQIEQALNSVGYRYIDITTRPQKVSLKRLGVTLDLGAIAKGYAVDRAVAVLRKEGIHSALVNVGGDIYCLGRKDRFEKWAVGLQSPRKRQELLTCLKMEDRACATSGDYQRYVEIDGCRYSHIIDPRTGHACGNSPASVTVLAQNCLEADALATSIFVLGVKKGIDLVEKLKDTEAIIIEAEEKEDLNIIVSQGLEGKLQFTP